MQKVISFIVYYTLWLLSKLPFALLYFISDLFYLITYYIVGYRKKIVRHNLQSFFPDKSISEIKSIEKQFYHHFIDVFIEMIKSFSIREEELNKRFVIYNIELLNQLCEKKQSVIINGSHYSNWEWVIGMHLTMNHEPFVVYSKLKNDFLDKKIKENRGRFGLGILTKQEITKKIEYNAENNIPAAYGFLSDQSPRMKRAYYWTNFLGARVPVFTGAESLAKKHNLAMVFMDIQKVKRGHYTCTLELMTDQPNSIPNFELTNLYLQKVETQIRNKPTYYLWTHKRLKHAHREHLKPEMPPKENT